MKYEIESVSGRRRSTLIIDDMTDKSVLLILREKGKDDIALGVFTKQNIKRLARSL